MKKMLTAEAIETQTALELPARELPLVTIVVTNVLNNLDVDINVSNNNIAVQVCAIVEVLNTELFRRDTLDCDIQQ